MEKLKKYILKTRSVVVPTALVLGYGSSFAAASLHHADIYDVPSIYLFIGPVLYFVIDWSYVFLALGTGWIRSASVKGNVAMPHKSSAESAHRAATMLNVTGVYYDPRK